jgi:DNA-binding MarR family transcriptional regulator
MARRDEDALAEEWHQLMGRYTRLMCALDRELAAHDLTASEFEVLQQLELADECSLRMNVLGDSAHLSQSALSRLVSRLERDGLVERKACEQDRRSLFVALLPESVREGYGIRWTPVQRVVAAWLAGTWRGWRPILPLRLRWFSAALEAAGRVADQ